MVGFDQVLLCIGSIHLLGFSCVFFCSSLVCNFTKNEFNFAVINIAVLS